MTMTASLDSTSVVAAASDAPLRRQLSNKGVEDVTPIPGSRKVGRRTAFPCFFRKPKKILALLFPAIPLWQIVRQATLIMHHDYSSRRHHQHQNNNEHQRQSPGNPGENDAWMTNIMKKGATSRRQRPKRGNTESNTSTSLLRFDWTNLELTSIMAKRMAAHQQANCTTTSLTTSSSTGGVGQFRFRNRFGLGSDLHLWTVALCNAMERQLRLHTILPWIFWDQESCQAASMVSKNNAVISFNESSSSMACYFPHAEPRCSGTPLPAAATPVYKLYRGQGRISVECPAILKSMGASSSAMDEFRAAGIEFLFSRVSPLVQWEAERQLRRVFSRADDHHTNNITTRIGDNNGLVIKGTNNNDNKDADDVIIVPADLITVHIRWGDKKTEMKLVSIEEYIEAVKTIQQERGRSTDTASIFLATEDPRAVQEMRAQAPAGWNIYVDQYYHEYSSNLQHHRNDGDDVVYNGNPLMSKAFVGKPGLTALGSLLVAMEANDFVLTTHSNWSRLMNELRTNIIDPRCQNCTKMIDLRPPG